MGESESSRQSLNQSRTSTSSASSAPLSKAAELHCHSQLMACIAVIESAAPELAVMSRTGGGGGDSSPSGSSSTDSDCDCLARALVQLALEHSDANTCERLAQVHILTHSICRKAFL